MIAGQFETCHEARSDAEDRLDRARTELDEAVAGVQAPAGASQGRADWRLAHAENRVAAQEAWLAWVELAD